MTAQTTPGLERAQDARSGAEVTLRILATTDLHGQIMPWDDIAERAAPGRGLAQVATLIRSARAEVAQSILLDNGDFLNGSPLSDHVAETRAITARAPHPMIVAMNRLGYDAATLGNHEFSMGLGFLRHCLRGATFPIVSANLDRVSPGGRRGFLPRQLLLRRVLRDGQGRDHAVTIGITGVLPPQTLQWERRHLQGCFDATDGMVAVRRAAQRLRQAGADLVVVLAHSGIGGPDPAAGAENIAAALAGCPGVDAVVAGHTHQTFPPEGGADRPLMMPGFFGSHLGVMDLRLAHDGAGWRVIGHQIDLRPVSRRVGQHGRLEALVPTAPDIVAAGAADRADMRARAATIAGHCTVPLTSYFAMIGHSAVQDLLANAQAALARKLLVGRPEAALPLLVAVAPFKAGGRGGPENYIDIPQGPLTTRHIADLYTHPNSLTVLSLRGDEVALWLERAVSAFCQVPAGAQDAPLLDPDFPPYNVDMIHGLTFAVDLTQPAMFDAQGSLVAPHSRRIRGLCHGGQPVLPGMRFALASNSYRASGGAGFAGADADHTVLEDARALRRVLEDYVRDQSSVSPSAAAGWRFAPCAGTSVTIDSAPAAARLAADCRAEPLQVLPSGFQRFRLRL